MSDNLFGIPPMTYAEALAKARKEKRRMTLAQFRDWWTNQTSETSKDPGQKDPDPQPDLPQSPAHPGRP